MFEGINGGICPFTSPLEDVGYKEAQHATAKGDETLTMKPVSVDDHDGVPIATRSPLSPPAHILAVFEGGVLYI